MSSSSLPLRKYDGKIERLGMEYSFPKKLGKNKGRVWEEERKLTFLYDIFAAFMEADFETRIYSSDNNSKKHLGHTCRSVASILRDNFIIHLIGHKCLNVNL